MKPASLPLSAQPALPAIPGIDEVRQATTAARQLAAIPEPHTRTIRVTSGGLSEPVEVPESAFKMLQEILLQMAMGNAVTLVPTHHELTTQQAADIIKVSRPYFVKLLEKGAIPYHRVGSRRRVRFQDLMTYAGQQQQRSREALDELAAQAQALNLGY